MRPMLLAAMAAVLLWGGGPVEAQRAQRLSEAEVKQQIIQESIDAYPGNCPCPYNRASNGSRCGRRSAYSRGGGYAPICFEEDVTQKMVQDWRRANA